MENLIEFKIENCPIKSFNLWLEEAKLIEENAEAMSVATYDSIKKRPSNRFLLFKGLESTSNNIKFYTNYNSDKSKQLFKIPEIALNFYWFKSKKQIRIQGLAKKMNQIDSIQYFYSRDRESQLASYISNQSEKIENKNSLLEKFKKVENQFKNQPIPYPENWGGFLVEPYEFEFFLYGDHRLNDRFLYTKNSDLSWDINRLSP